MMELASEDSLRLNVLLANELEAIRIDESSMTVYGLSARGESAVRLNPNCRDEQYLRRVREMLSSHVLGSPGGYPVYLRRWTRMGQARDDSLEKLLLLGEPEAVVAVVHAAGLTDELAQRAWWAMPTADNARNMLARACIASGSMGPVLAEYLVEYLPFEQEHGAMIDSIRLVLQPGLISDDTEARLWAKAKHKLTYYVGFLDAVPDELPEAMPPHPTLAGVEAELGALIEAGNLIAAQLLRLLGATGQAYLTTLETVLRKPANQDVMVALVESLERYFASVADAGPRLQTMDEILQKVEGLVAGAQPVDSQRPAQVQAVLRMLPQLRRELYAMLVLSEVGEPLVAPIFARTDAIGSVMRRRLEPVTGPLLQQIAILRGAAS
jgi:hypothetical protein